MNTFSLQTRLYSGHGSLAVLKRFTNKHIWIICDGFLARSPLLDTLRNALPADNRISVFSEITPDPTIHTVVQGIAQMQALRPQVVIGFGGGSAMDAAKAIVWFSQQSGINIETCVAIPTTSGTGSEVTSFSVVKARSEKLVLVDPSLLPDIAILDPSLVASVPPAITADTGMDVLCHALEAYVSRAASDFSDALAEKVVQQVFRYLPACWRDGHDLLAREKMHNASCMAGMAFTNASLGITHSLAHALGGVFRVPHGRANALLMAQVVAWNADHDGQCDTQAAHKYARLAHLLDLPANTPREGVNSLLVAIQALKDEMKMPAGIGDTGLLAADFDQRLAEMVSQALRDNCTPTNPRAPDARALTELYRKAWCGTLAAGH